jgi:dipeptidyl aminopeptidase/acylaminoacyl peptidase
MPTLGRHATASGGRDPRVEAAVAHWAHRFVANGVPLSDFQEVTAQIDRWEDWCAAWSRRAEVHEALGEEALAGGHHLSAGDHLTRAAVCYHFAKYLFVQAPDEMREVHQRAVDCRHRALPHLRPPGERVEIPYEGTAMPGILRRPARVQHPPVVVMVMGLDSAKEEMDTNERPFLDRGIATLTIDGPGQGELEYDLPIRGDWEVPIAVVLDWIEAQAALDADRVAVWGVSLGGYYAPRAAAVERRLRACIALAGPYNFGEAWEGLPELTREAFRVRSHLQTEAEARRHAHSLSLEGMAERITRPLLVVFGRQDRLLPPAGAERLAAECKTALLLV